MDSDKKSSGRHGENKNIFMRLFDWIARGAAKSQKGGGQCTN